jgi:hypothetical protein
MPLAIAHKRLSDSIFDALSALRNSAANTGAEPTQIIDEASKKIGDAVRQFIESADVQVNITVDPGQVDFPAGGTTTTAGAGRGSGAIKTVGDHAYAATKFSFESAKNAALNGLSSDKIIEEMSERIAGGIKLSLESATISTSDTINPGQGAFGALGFGQYTSSGAGTGFGKAVCRESSRIVMVEKLKMTFIKSREDASTGNISSDTIIRNTAKGWAQAIYSFSLDAVLKTNHIVMPGVPVIGYVNPATLSPVPSTSSQGTAKGNGSLK